jgi:hypothetical protein
MPDSLIWAASFQLLRLYWPRFRSDAETLWPTQHFESILNRRNLWIPWESDKIVAGRTVVGEAEDGAWLSTFFSVANECVDRTWMKQTLRFLLARSPQYSVVSRCEITPQPEHWGIAYMEIRIQCAQPIVNGTYQNSGMLRFGWICEDGTFLAASRSGLVFEKAETCIFSSARLNEVTSTFCHRVRQRRPQSSSGWRHSLNIQVFRLTDVHSGSQ